jgi:hypothetical protein
MQFYCQNTIRPKKDTKLCLRVEKWSRSVSHLFFNFYTKLAESSFLCRFHVESVNVFVCAMCFSSTNNFTHAQTLYRMSSLCRSYECMNIVRVNIGVLTGWKKIKQRRISFVLGYLRMILWKISTAISIKHRILATFNIKINSILTACMPLMESIWIDDDLIILRLIFSDIFHT